MPVWGVPAASVVPGPTVSSWWWPRPTPSRAAVFRATPTGASAAMTMTILFVSMRQNLAGRPGDPRRTNRDMAAELGIAPSTCLERIRGLRDRGVISGYHAEVDLKAIDRSTQ